MGTQLHYTVGKVLRDSIAGLTGDERHVVFAVERRQRTVLARRLKAVEAALLTAGARPEAVDTFPDIADQLRYGGLHETVVGCRALAYIGEVHGSDDHTREGTVVFDDAALAHLWVGPNDTTSRWQLFEDGAPVADRWTLGLSMMLGALTGKSGRWGGPE